MVLGRPAEARQAGEAAIQGVRDAAQRSRIEALVAELGLRNGAVLP
jgi:hypothetical protein